jgi:hypothetical protein
VWGRSVIKSLDESTCVQHVHKYSQYSLSPFTYTVGPGNKAMFCTNILHIPCLILLEVPESEMRINWGAGLAFNNPSLLSPLLPPSLSPLCSSIPPSLPPSWNGMLSWRRATQPYKWPEEPEYWGGQRVQQSIQYSACPKQRQTLSLRVPKRWGLNPIPYFFRHRFGEWEVWQSYK